ncbi:phage tail tape measure protein [Paenibacillus sp. P32E]|uniref:phage tail tape measure protein n=1 Tax=Paenibacillus sp. P32E TaxID=1349434 RepID=UPI00093E0C1D|nr:phage tail tape measure protein [Paenibacillus sp. P32E]OKP91330.1 hypothetical protein A3848_09485 [Paenibacillus sp. P32E]
MASEFYQLDLVIGTSGVERTEQQLRAIERMMEQAQRRAAALGRSRINPTVQLNDRLTSPAGRITSSLNRLDRINARPEVRLVDRATAGLGKVSSMLGRLTRKAFRVTVNTAFTGAAMLTAGAAYTAVKSTQKAMAFQHQMKSIQALTQIDDKQLGQMQALALAEGMRTKYNALQVAEGIETLFKAGLSMQKIQEGALGAGLNLATAGGMQMSEAAELMSTSLNAYKKDALTAAEASNILAGTANASAIDLNDLRYSLSMVGAVADGVGSSFLDTNLALGVFGNNGLKGSDAGTSLKTFLINLVPETAKAYNVFKQFDLLTVDVTESMKKLTKAGIKPASTSVKDITSALEKYVTANTGIKSGTAKAAKMTKDYMMSNALLHSAFYDQKGNIKDMASIADLLQNRLKKLTNEQRQYYLKQMFGTDAIRAANILYKEGAKGIKAFQREMSNVTALKVAQDKMNSATGAVEMFKGAMETLQISALIPTLPIIQKVATKLAQVVSKYTPEITAAMEDMTSKAEAYVKTHFLNDPKFQKLSIKGKIGFVFDDLQAEFDKWYGSTGRGVVVNMAGKIGAGLGGALKGVFMGALGLLDDGDDSPYQTAGESAGTAFFKAFIGAFDAGAIAKKAADSFANSTMNSIQNPSAGNLLDTGLRIGAGAYLYKKFLKPLLNDGKGVFKKSKNFINTITGKGTAGTAATEGTIIAGESAARGAATGAGSIAEGAASAASRTVRNPTGPPVNRPIIDQFDPRFRPGNKVTVKALEMPGVKIAAKAAIPLMVAADTYSIATAKPGRDRAEKIGSSAGGWAGAWGGATAGAAIGSVFPGPGTAIGALIGGIGGGIAGAWGGKKASDKIMDVTYGKEKAAPPVAVPAVDAWMGDNSPGVDAVLNRKPISFTPLTPESTIKASLPLVSDVISKSFDTFAAKLNLKNSSQIPTGAPFAANASNEKQTVYISPEQISTMENGIRNIKAETTNQINVSLPYGAIQVNVKSDDIDYDAIGQQVGSRIADAMRRKTQNLK